MGRSGQQGFVGNVGLRRCTCCGCLVCRSFAPAVRLSYIKGFQSTLNGEKAGRNAQITLKGWRGNGALRERERGRAYFIHRESIELTRKALIHRKHHPPNSIISH